MNKTKIEWTDYSWNPIVGCKHGCWYCYARRLAKRFPKNFPNGFEPTFYPERLDQPTKVKKPSKIFVCSISDLFAPWTRKKWREAVLKAIKECPVKHTFQLLTKNPEWIGNYKFPDNAWVGTTATQLSERHNIKEIKNINARVKFVSFEPLLGSFRNLDLNGIDWVIIGKLTGSKKIKLDPFWVSYLIMEARQHDIPLFLKDNLNWHEKIQEFPCH